MAAPEDFVAWVSAHEHKDKHFGWVYRYHPRSDKHSVALCEMVLKDLLNACPSMVSQAKSDKIVYGINVLHAFPSGKSKTLDLAIGTSDDVSSSDRFCGSIRKGTIKRVLIACEAKAVMTEHGKSQPRLFDELSSSHEIVHQGDRPAIAAGITVVNIAETFVSPLRQKSTELHISKHKQPHVTERMINHLRGLPIREGVDGIGFDAFGIIVVDCDNQGPVRLWTELPAPQEDDRDLYAKFISRIATAFETRFG